MLMRRALLSRRNWLPIAGANNCCHSTNPPAAADSVDPDDVQHHAKLAADWWNPNGPMRFLQSMNAIRVPFIRDGILNTRTDTTATNPSAPLAGCRLLEVGCGAGFLTEALGRLQARITAIDPGHAVIDAARDHLEQQPNAAVMRQHIDYRTETIEVHSAERPNVYDAVIVSEVLEHVVDKERFLRACVRTIRPGGSLFVTTFNRTTASWLGAIVVAEYVTTLVPRGTHDWERFIGPIELQRLLGDLHCTTAMLNGFTFDVICKRWRWIPTLDMSYALHAIKTE